MKFIAGKIGGKGKIDIEAKLRNSKEVTVATAYFYPRDATMKSLEKVRSLKLIYSDEYQITDPEKLWQLVSNGSEVRYVPTRDPEGKLHAKIYLGIRKTGSKFAFVGSGNLTDDGFFQNQEAVVLFDSRNTGDRETIEKIYVWLTNLWVQHKMHIFNEAKYEEAKSQHEAAKRWLRKKPKEEPNEIHPWKQNTKSKWGKDWGEIRYWVLKTRNGRGGDDYWEYFVKEKVIAIGWPLDSGRARMFTEFNIGDIVLVCNGYPPNTRNDTPILIRGVARVVGDAYKDAGSKWWNVKREAVIQVINKEVKKRLMAKYLDRASLLIAAHQIHKPDYFEKLAIKLHREYGVKIDV